MGIWNTLGNALKGVVKSVDLKSVGQSLLNAVKPANLLETATSFLTSGPIGGAMNFISNFTSAPESGSEPANPKIKIKSSSISELFEKHKENLKNGIDKKRERANALREQRNQAITAVKNAAVSGYLSQLDIKEDMLFAAIRAVSEGKHKEWGWVKNVNSSQGASGNDLLTAPTMDSFTEITLVASLESTDFSIGGSITTIFERDLRQYFDVTGIGEIASVVTIIQKLQYYTANIDNPFDFFNFWGYNGAEVVNPLSSIPSAVIDGMLMRISRHKISKSMAQWFAAVANYSSELVAYRKITADWLGTQANNMPPFMIDMISFWVLKRYGIPILIHLYSKYCTREMNAIITPSNLSNMHIYDICTQFNYMQSSARITWESGNIVLPASPSQEEQCQAKIRSFHLVVMSWLLQLSLTVSQLSSFGIDNEDIQDIFNTLTTADPVVEDLSILCDKDNADLLSLDDDEMIQIIAHAQFSSAEIEMTEDTVVDDESVQTFIKDMESVITSTTVSLNVVSTAINLCGKTLGLIEQEIQNNDDTIIRGRFAKYQATLMALLTQLKTKQRNIAAGT